MKSIVISDTVEHDLCIGCGVCAAVCPDKILEMRFNRFGEYNPFEIADCTKECGLCLKVCPFTDGTPDEDAIGQLLFGEVPDIQHRSETGYFLEAFVGHSQIDGHRERGSSGGMATWLLQTLLASKKVDAVVCVTSNPDPGKLFRFAVFATAEEVRAASGSAYYPVELSEVLVYIIEHPGRYAVIGLPCFVKAIRLAQLRNRNLRERIVVVLGLVCGQLKSKHYTAYLAALAGLESAPTQVHFRGKDPAQPAGNFYFSCRAQNGVERRLYWNSGVSEAWHNRWFTPMACNYCDDIFAEGADVTFMDAWLPEYSGDSRGTNLAIVRSPQIRDVMRAGCDSGALIGSDISIDEVISSQAGVIAKKRVDLVDRLYVAHRRRFQVPNKRVSMRPVGNPFRHWAIHRGEEMQQASHRNFADAIENGDFVCEIFRGSMTHHLNRMRLARGISAGMILPVRVAGRLRRYLHD